MTGLLSLRLVSIIEAKAQRRHGAGNYRRGPLADTWTDMVKHEQENK